MKRKSGAASKGNTIFPVTVEEGFRSMIRFVAVSDAELRLERALDILLAEDPFADGVVPTDDLNLEKENQEDSANNGDGR